MLRHVYALALALLLGGCASTPPVALVDADTVYPTTWTLQGRIGIRTDEQSLSGQVHWQHRTDRDELLMTSPLGQGVARIVRDHAGVILEVPNQPARQAPDAEALTREVLGYGLPVSGLTWWVQARPAPGRVFETVFDSAGRVEQLKQDGWVIDYLKYMDDAPMRPRKLVVTRKGLEIRLVTDSWENE